MTNPGLKRSRTNKKMLKQPFWESKMRFFSNFAKYLREGSQSKRF